MRSRRPVHPVIVDRPGDLMAVHPHRIELPVSVAVFAMFFRGLWRLGVWCVRHPRTVVLIVVWPILWRLAHERGLLVVLVPAVVGGLVWRWRRPSSWWRYYGGPLLGWWRRQVIYRRSWDEVMGLCGLAKIHDYRVKSPRLLRVRCDEALDRLTVRMVRGQNPADFHRETVNLAYAFGRRQARVFSEHPDDPPTRRGRLAPVLRAVDRVRFRDRPTMVYIVLVRTDALRKIVAPLPVPTVPDFTALQLGVREDMRPYRLHLLATHVLIGGATRRGKGSVLWSLVRSLAGGISSGLVRLWVIDPKGGMEFAMGRPLFARFAYSSFEAMAALLEEAVSVMQERQERLGGHVRVHTPSVADPLIVVVIDEMAALTAYLQDRDLRRRIANALGMLLSQGAGVGVLVVAALQDPRKDILPFRNLFPTRIALGLTEESEVDMVLGDGARARGAVADQMPRWAKGVGYVILDGTPEPVRVRFSYITDPDIIAMAEQYVAPADPDDMLAQLVRQGAPEPEPASLDVPTMLEALPPIPGQVGRDHRPLLPRSLGDLLKRFEAPAPREPADDQAHDQAHEPAAAADADADRGTAGEPS